MDPLQVLTSGAPAAAVLAVRSAAKTSMGTVGDVEGRPAGAVLCSTSIE